MSVVSRKKKECIAKELLATPDVNRTELAKRHGVSRGTVYHIAKKSNAILAPGQVDSESKLMAQKVLADQHKRLYRESIKQLAEVRKELMVFREYQDVKNLIVPQNQEVQAYKGTTQAVPILVISDWHIDEPVDPETICGLNEFSVAIARDRVARLTKYATKIIGILKGESDIEHLVVAALGDFMSGWIHEELQTANELTPVEAVLEVLNMLTGLIQNLLDAGVVRNITMVCCVGNHSRITQKTFYKLRTKTSYEWMIYNLLMSHFSAKGETRVKFQIPTGYFNWVNVCGHNVRCHHGDNLRYNGGVGGVHIPVKKAIAQWNKGKTADLDLFGHWHTLNWASDYIINGSLIGYNTFAEMLKADYQKAQQAIFLMHSRFDTTALYPIKLQD